MMCDRHSALVRAALVTLAAASWAHAAGEPQQAAVGTGFQGIWFKDTSIVGEYGPKYGGGLGLYPHQHNPIATYSPEANKTFFVYGGASATGTLQHMISYYDHATGKVAQPRVWLDLGSTDGHDNPSLSIDGEGHLLMFSNVHGNVRESAISRSTYSVTTPGRNVLDSFQSMLSEPEDLTQNGQLVYGSDAGVPRFSYSNAWYVPGQGMLHLHTRYMVGGANSTKEGGERDLYWTTSTDSDTWTPRSQLASIEYGSYQLSWRNGQKVGTVLDIHPKTAIGSNPPGLNSRTNLYYMETGDLGKTWKTASGKVMTTPVTTITNDALVHDYRSENQLVYMKDLNYDAAGNPVILYLTTPTASPGPANPERMLHTASWTGSEWRISDIVTTDHDYDHGSLYIEADGTWRVIGPFINGPEAWATGGEIGVWTSSDQGQHWVLSDQLTSGSTNNHTYVRRPFGAQDDFYALWADGDAVSKSTSLLYFATADGAVYQLPSSADAFVGGFADPIEVRAVPEPVAASLAGAGSLLLLRRQPR